LRKRNTPQLLLQLALISTPIFLAYLLGLYLLLAYIPVLIVIGLAALCALILRGRKRVLIVCWAWLLVITPTFGLIPLLGMLRFWLVWKYLSG
jgi:hypothetical protein